MPVRATKRGAERTPLQGHYDVLICGASFAGLAVARELSGSGARVMMIDRYEVGERQTSACAAPTEWIRRLDLTGAMQQTFGRLVVHSPKQTFTWNLPFTFSTFDYRTICGLQREQSAADVEFETAKVNGRGGRGSSHTVHTDRGDLTADLVVDALGWKRVLGTHVQPPNARMSRGLEIHPHAPGDDLTLWIDPKYIKRGYSWSFPADGELRVGVGSFDPHDHVKDPTIQLASDVGVPAERWQGNWIPHQLRPGTEDGIFFVGDSGGHCLPTTAEGIRPAWYFGVSLGRELRAVVEGRQTKAQALDRYGAFTASHQRWYDLLLHVQNLVGRITPTPVLNPVLRGLTNQRMIDSFFGRYYGICEPELLPPGSASAQTAPALAA